MRIITFISLLLIASISISGCNTQKKSTSAKTSEESAQQSAEKLYTKAYKELNKGNFETALVNYEALIVKFPFGPLTQQAKLDRIFVLDRLRQVADATQAVQSFIDQYPAHPNIDYTYYMKGVITFNKRRGFLERTTGGELTTRNKKNMQSSYDAFDDLLQKFPNSSYAPDASKRMIFLRNSMADYELEVARFYSTRNANVATINRCKYIIENYDRSPAVIEALQLMASTYRKMGLIELAQQTESILQDNYANLVQQVNEEKPSSLWSKLPKLPSLFGGKEKKQ